LEKAKQSLMDATHFNQAEDTTADEEEPDVDDELSMPVFGKFESRKARYKHNMKQERFREPRMFTMQQIRNICFSVLNQSTLNDRLTLNEERMVRVFKTTLHLDEIDKQIRLEGERMNAEMSERVNKWKEEFAQMQRHNEKVMQEHKMRLASNSETIVKHREMIDENKHMLSANGDLISKVSSKLTQSKDMLQNEIKMSHDELMQKTDTLEKCLYDQVQIMDKQVKDVKNDAKSQLNETNEASKKIMFEEIEGLKTFVGRITDHAKAHREEL